MSRLSPIGRFFRNWFVSTFILAALGLILGSTVFFYAYPGKPKIAIIDIPFTVITEESAFEIGAMLTYARTTDSIKGVVIKLDTPGGSAAASENLYFEMLRLREEKPVVLVMDEIVASGGYMMSLGANYLFAKPATFVGSIGVILSPLPPLLPPPPSERDGTTGPSKLGGGSRRDFVSMTDQLRQSFAQFVFTQRGDKLTIPLEEVMEARIYSGVEGVRLGLVDAIGSETDAIKKVADLAGVSGYSLVDVNTEVARIFNQKIERILEPIEPFLAQRLLTGQSEDRELLEQIRATGDLTLLDRLDELDRPEVGGALRTLPSPGGIGADPQEALPNLPLEITGTNVYYLYTGPTR